MSETIPRALSFDWHPFYRELAEKLIPYRARQSDLLAILEKLRARDLPVTPTMDIDESGKKFPLEVMDPFTFFGCFNRGITKKFRLEILAVLKSEFEIEAPLPTDFQGIPILNNQKSWFFGRSFKRKPDDIDRLWEVHAHAFGPDPLSAPAFCQAFDRAMEVKGVSANLTVGLFWMRPDYFLNLDSRMRDYLGIKSAPKLLKLSEYREIVQKVRSQHGPDFPGLSHRVWEGGQAPIEDEDDGDPEEKRLVLIGTWRGVSPAEIQRIRKAIEERGGYANWWSFPIRVEFAPDLQDGFHLYLNSGGGIFQYRFWVESFRTSKGNDGMISPWPEMTDDSDRGKSRASASNAEVFKTWLRVTSVEELEKPITLDWFDPAPGIKRQSLLNPSSFGYAVLTKRVNVVGHASTEPDQYPETTLDGPPSDFALNTIFYGPPGTGKTYRLLTECRGYFGQGRVRMVTFHQSYGYEDFVEGIRPEVVGASSGAIRYEIRHGVFRRICAEAAKDQGHKYALFIDEINRGNISKIFGELISLIEEDKRIGSSNAMTVELPYSGDAFGVPSNLYIIGTMNSADRSIALLDIALRRRFEFIELLPETSLIQGEDGNGSIPDGAGGRIDLRLLLSKINERIEFLFDSDHSIGHAYLMDVRDFGSLANVMRNRIVPLLQEYFYGDWDKIQLVFGDIQGRDKKPHPEQIVTHVVRTPKATFGTEHEALESRRSHEVAEVISPGAIRKIYADSDPAT